MIHGIGGVGKSSLLRMFRLHCRDVGVPVALASGDESKSALAILTDWAEDLKADGVTLPTFTSTLQHYRSIQAKAEEKAQASRKKMGDLAGKAAGKVAETAAGAAVGAAIGSVIPGIGTLVGALGGMGAEALVGWLLNQGFVRPDVDLLLDPAHKLTADFLSGIADAASKRRLVLMLDTFEQLSALEDWARDLAQHLYPTVLLVIAGRKMPNWSRAWPGWLAQTHVEELKPMTEDVMRDLVRRYYATMRGGEPDPKQVEAIIRFARGLPMVVTTAVSLWVEYGVEDFEMVKAEVVADLVDRLKEGIPEHMTPVLEAAAAVRWFNKEILRAVSTLADVNAAYDELRRFPFVRPRAEGFALHDAVRDILDEYQRVHDPQHHRELHERAAAYFEGQLAKRTGQDAWQLSLERVFHRVCSDEEAGVRLFQEMAEEFTRLRLMNQLRSLLNDVNTYHLENCDSTSWRRYYNARLLHLDGRYYEAKDVYQALSQDGKLQAKLRAYAMSDWGPFLRNNRELERSIETLQCSLSLIPVDSKLARGFSELGVSFRRRGQLTESTAAFEQAVAFYQRSGDEYGLLTAFNSLKNHYLYCGDLREALRLKEAEKKQLASLNPQLLFPRLQYLGHWAILWAWFGRLKETEMSICEALQLTRALGIIDDVGLHRDLAYTLSMQDRFDEGNEQFSLSLATAKRLRGVDPHEESMTLGFWGAALARQGRLYEAEENLLKSLESKRKQLTTAGEQEVCLWLGQLHETQSTSCPAGNSRIELQNAESFYREVVNLRWAGHRHFECSALAARIRIKYAQDDYTSIQELTPEAERLAQRYEYNDCLASLRMILGHVVWNCHVPEPGASFDIAFRNYQLALLFALRYNRFLLDEVLSGRPQGTPLRPIIPHCLERGDEGRKMLTALRDWWKTGANDTGAPRPDTISPIPEGVSLLEAERIARAREPGDGAPQAWVLEQIESALAGRILHEGLVMKQ